MFAIYDNAKVTNETITIKMSKGRYYKTFNAFGITYRISKAEALESIKNADDNGSMFFVMDGYWTYFN